MTVVAGVLRVFLLALCVVAVAGLWAERWWVAELLVSLRVQQVCVLVPVCSLPAVRRQGQALWSRMW